MRPLNRPDSSDGQPTDAGPGRPAREARPRSLAAMLLALVAACGGGEPVTVVAAPFTAAPQAVGAEACRDCHADLVDSYARTGMARALGPVEPGELEGLGELTSGPWAYGFHGSPDGRHYLLGETHAEHPGHALGAEVVYAIGAGVLDRSFAVLHGAGTFFAPVEVITTDAGRRLALRPGEAMEPGTRLGFPITPECLACHTDSLPPPTWPLEQLPDPARWTPRGISCGGCHGTADELAAHVTWQEADLSGEPTATRADPILDLASLGRSERLSVCARCHLQGDARLVLEDGALGPPHVGLDLLEHRALFVGPATPEEPGVEVGFVSQIERLALSTCFLESELDCATCHDPHAFLGEPEPRARVRAACATCHQPAACGRPVHEQAADDAWVRANLANGAAALARGPADCATCHMPLTGVFDVAEVLIHDHAVRRDGSDARGPTPEAELRFPEAPDGNWKRFTWPFAEAPAHRDEHGLWLMAYVAGGHLAKGLALVDHEPGPTAEGLAMYHHVRAGLLEMAGRTEDAEAAYRAALERDPELPPSLTNLALLLQRRGAPAEGLALLDALLERHPGAHGALRNRALCREALGDTAGALADLDRALGLAPDAALAATLSGLAAQLGRREDAARYAAIARDLDPTLR